MLLAKHNIINVNKSLNPSAAELFVSIFRSFEARITDTICMTKNITIYKNYFIDLVVEKFP